jgi:hypothetical protein
MRNVAVALCVVLLSTTACERRRQIQSRLHTASATGSGQVLDGMQLESARRVAREQAKEAMKARDVQRLHALRKWVEGRASVPVFPGDDLAALDIAIACLEHAAPPETTGEQLQRVKSSKLFDAARGACTPSAAE